MMKEIGFFLKKFDIYSIPISFFIDGEDRFSTYTGTFFSFLTIIATIVLSFLFGSEVYQRKNPFTRVSYSFVDNTYVYLNEYPLFFMLADGFGVKRKNIFDYLHIKVQNWHFENNQQTYYYDGEGHVISECNYSHFTSILELVGKEKVDEKILNNPVFCIKYKEGEDYVHNPYKATNSTFLHLAFKFCDVETESCPEDI